MKRLGSSRLAPSSWERITSAPFSSNANVSSSSAASIAVFSGVALQRAAAAVSASVGAAPNSAAAPEVPRAPEDFSRACITSCTAVDSPRRLMHPCPKVMQHKQRLRKQRQQHPGVLGLWMFAIHNVKLQCVCCVHCKAATLVGAHRAVSGALAGPVCDEPVCQQQLAQRACPKRERHCVAHHRLLSAVLLRQCIEAKPRLLQCGSVIVCCQGMRDRRWHRHQRHSPEMALIGALCGHCCACGCELVEMHYFACCGSRCASHAGLCCVASHRVAVSSDGNGHAVCNDGAFNEALDAKLRLQAKVCIGNEEPARRRKLLHGKCCIADLAACIALGRRLACKVLQSSACALCCSCQIVCTAQEQNCMKASVLP